MTDDATWYPLPGKLDWLPDGFPLQTVVQQVNKTGIYADTEEIPGIQAQIQQAHKLGLNLRVVYLNDRYPSHTFLRDLADYLEHEHPGTYLVMDQHNEAVASNIYPRVVLERSELHLSLDKPDQAVGQFVAALQIKEFPWTYCVMGLFFIAIICSLCARFLSKWNHRWIRHISHIMQKIQHLK